MAKRNNYESDFCGSLPLNHINVIQSYGYLVVLEKQSFKILQISENSEDLFKKSLSEIAGSRLSEYADTAQLTELEGRFNFSGEKIPLTLTLADSRKHCLAHFKNEFIILEIEKDEPAEERTFTKVFEEVKHAIALIESAASVIELSKVAIQELRKITGFDGIMMYQFDQDWNGTVIAEEKVSGLDNYLGHTFPGSDIPKPARDLYLKNPYRLIPDRDYIAVRLYPVVNPVSNSFIDLSDCNLRGVAAVHLEYLKNMNVQASMSIRVIDQGKLWGLIACHHLTPHNLSFEILSICELLSSVISGKLTNILHKHSFDTEADLNNSQTTLIAQVYSANDLIEGLTGFKEMNLQSLFRASGIYSNYQKRAKSVGEVPEDDVLENLFLWLQNKGDSGVFETDQLPEIFDEAAPYSKMASGLLSIPIDAENGEFIVMFRPEVVQTIKWGGDPNTRINFEPGTDRYHPRASFELWQQQVHNTAEPWTKEEIRAAENIGTFINEFIKKKNRV